MSGGGLGNRIDSLPEGASAEALGHLVITAAGAATISAPSPSAVGCDRRRLRDRLRGAGFSRTLPRPRGQGGLLGQQGLAVGLRDLIIIRVDFREGQKPCRFPP